MFLIQARMGSTRLPGKSLMKLFKEYSLIEIVYLRTLLSKYASNSNIVVLTSIDKEDDPLYDFCMRKNINCFRGSNLEVRNRYIQFFESINHLPEYFIRICADNPFLEPVFIDKMIEFYEKHEFYDYISYITTDNTPAIQTKYGFFAELIKTKTFINVNPNFLHSDDIEHVTPLFYRNSIFNKYFFEIDKEIERNRKKLSIDTIDDFIYCKKIIEKVNSIKFTYKDILDAIR